MGGSEDSGGSFEDRLKAARRRQGMDHESSESSGGETQPGFSALGIGLRVGLELVSAMVVSVTIGWWLDRWLHTSPVLLGVIVLLGFAAGIANVWRLMGPGGQGAGDGTELRRHPRGGAGDKGRDSGG